MTSLHNVVSQEAQALGLPGWWLPALLVAGLLVAVAALAFFAVTDWQRYQRRGTRRGYRQRKSAHERFAAARAAARSSPEFEPQPPPEVQPEPRREPAVRRSIAPPSRQPEPPPDDDLLRDLLGQ